MKKYYIVSLCVILAMIMSSKSANAQLRQAEQTRPIETSTSASQEKLETGLPIIPNKATYDTLFFEDFQSQTIPVTWQNLDLDGNTDANGRPANWYITMDDQTTVGIDTNWVAASSSWFSPFAIANNWLILPAFNIVSGDLLVWQSAPFEGPTFCDGYKVMISTTDSLTTSFTDTLAVFAESVNGTATQTSGVQHTNYNGSRGILQTWSYDLSAYSGQRIHIAFVHDSNDDNMLLLDNILIGQECTPTAAYSYSASYLLVNFTNLSSSGTNPSYMWDFGDGNTSTQANPSHTYTMTGTYTVCLVVTDSCAADTICDTVSVTACTPPTASFTYVPSGTMVSFTNTSTVGGGASYFWDFGDGNTSSAENPVHSYSSPGTYTACLIAQDSCAADTSCLSVTVSTTGVENSSDQEFSVFPNPTNGKLTIEFSGVQEYVSVSIHTVLGQEIYREVFENAQTIQLELDQPNGTYILELSDNNGNKSIMQVIKK
ncbi:MAG: hypothetical protein C0592_11825 [Marinilabiliales bacterium]|nr:MAG: hypothetical protein C0592_11825 [Marinilabiliales bacterium]